jgi:HK97 family phage portal protein
MFGIFKRKKKTPIKYTTFNYNTWDSQTGQDSTSFAGIDLICNAFAALGFDFYSFYTREKTGHRLKELLADPNSEITRFDFFYHSARNLYTHGNCYWYKYDIDGEIVSLFLLNPADVRVQRDSVTNEKLFYYNGGAFKSDKILHVPSRFGYNGLIGQSVFTVCNAIFRGIADLDLYVRNSFKSNVGKRLMIDVSANPDMSNEQIQEYREKFIRDYGGVNNSGVPLIKTKRLGFDVVDSGLQDNHAQQLEENRRFNEKEIAKLLGVPLELLSGGDLKKDIESIYTLFLDNAIRPLASQFEGAVNKFLLNGYERQEVYFEFSYNSLLKTSLQARIDAYVKQLNNGLLSVNEIRKKENLPEIEAGDYHFVPANYMPLREDTIEAYMAGAKLKGAELQGLQKSNSAGFHGENPPIGDDKL